MYSSTLALSKKSAWKITDLGTENLLDPVLKMLPVTELMNIPFVKSTQSSATTKQTTHN